MLHVNRGANANVCRCQSELNLLLVTEQINITNRKLTARKFDVAKPANRANARDLALWKHKHY